MAVVNPIINPNVKDSRWLTLEVCREYQRNKCTRTEHECKFAHPPAHVEVQNGRVIACFDSIKGKCQRKDPPCKYLHPPQHLREQLLQNGRNNLILRSLQMHTYHPQMIAPSIIPMAGGKAVAYPTAVMPPGQIPYQVAAAVPQSRPPAHVSHPASFVSFASSPSATAPTPHYLSTVPTSAVAAAQYNPYGLTTVPASPAAAVQSGAAADATLVTSQIPSVITTVPAKAQARPDRLEPQVVEVVAQSKKRLRDSAEEIVLPSYVIPPYKRLAVEGSTLGSKGGLPAVYQPAIPTASAAAAYQQAALMQLQQQPSYPLTYSGDMMSAAYTNYLPQVAGHPPAVPRF